MNAVIRVGRACMELKNFENPAYVYFRVSDEVFNESSKIIDGNITVRRMSLYEEWDRQYQAEEVRFARHPVQGWD